MTSAKKNKLIASIVTIVVHAMIVALLLVLCFRTPLPLPGEAGVEVNLGMYEQGLTTTSRQDNEPARQDIKEAVRQEETVEDTDDIVSEDSEIPAIEPETKPEAQEVKKEEIVEEKEEQPVINKRALFYVTPNSNTSSSEGDTKPEGIQGSPEGLKDMDRYEGHGGSGNGPAYDLGGRGAKSIPSPSREFEEEGKVVVDIWVDKDGLVQRAEIGKGTTVTNITMRESALQAALKSTFTEDKKASDLQKGTITYTFIIRQ